MRLAPIGRWPVLRASVFAVLAVSLATGAHVAGGGAVPGALTIAIGSLVSVVPAAVLSRRARGPASLLLVLGGLQIALHGLLSVSETARCGGLRGSGMSGMSEVTAHAASSTCMSMPVAHTSTAMLGAHLAAVLATALLLARGEHVVVVLWHLLAPRAASVVVADRRWVAVPLPSNLPAVEVPALSFLAIRRRGPPPALSVA